MSSREPQPDQLKATDKERGASLFLMVLMLTIVLFGAAIALDLSVTTNRAQNLQNAADSAALAGVQALRSDEVSNAATDAERAVALEIAQEDARQAVDDLLRQNGIDTSAVNVNVEFPDGDEGTEVRVSLSDPNPGRLLNGVTGADSDVVRSATASFESCAALCSETIEIPQVNFSIQADGTGDGWLPLIVDHRTYAINHHAMNGEMLCVNSNTQDNCWEEGGRPAYAPGLSVFSPDVPNAAVIDGVIYWTAGYGGASHVFCWQTITDTPCTSPFRISDLTSPNSTQKESVGGLVKHDDLLYIFSADHRVHCVNPGLPMSTCAGYGSEGNDANLADLNFPSTDPTVEGGSFDRAFTIVDHDSGRLYWKTEIAAPVEPVQIVHPFMDVSQSSTDYGGNVERAIDGNTDGKWSNGSVTHTEDEFQPWWQIDLGDQELLHSVKLFNRTDSCCVTRLEDFFVFVHDQDMTGRSLDDLLADSTVTRILEGTDGAWENEDAGEREIWEASVLRAGRYVRVQLNTLEPDPTNSFFVDGSDPLSLAEVQIFAYEGLTAIPDITYDGGTWLQCWDTTINDACIGFTSARMAETNHRWWGRPFFQRSPAGDITAVCMFVNFTADTPCVNHITGNSEGSMPDLTEDVQEARTAEDFMGEPFEIPEFNRLYIPASYKRARMVCWSFTTNSECGTVHQPLNDEGKRSQDYGYAQQLGGGDCVFGMGHGSFFWSFKASDVTSECDTAETDTVITPCACGGTLQWGTAEFDIDLAPYERFEVTLWNQAGTQVYPPPGQVHTLFETGGPYSGPIVDMNSLPILSAADELTVRIFVQTNGNLTDANGDQDLTIYFGNRPHLID